MTGAWHPAAASTRIALALVAASAAAYAADTDLVNERPSVTREQLERHWGVDCARLRNELLAAADADTVRGGAPEPRARWSRELALCAAAHNTPADRSAPACPDYARAARALDTDAADDRHTLKKAIQEALRCDP